MELFTHQLAVCPLVILARQFVNCQVALEHTRDEEEEELTVARCDHINKNRILN